MNTNAQTLTATQHKAWLRLKNTQGWVGAYDYTDAKPRTLNALVKKNLAEKRQRPGWSDVAEYRAVSSPNTEDKNEY